jgi:hypothetical protein
MSRHPIGADRILSTLEIVLSWSVDQDLLAVMGNEMPPRDPNDDDDDEEDEELEPPVAREPDPDE